jgi:hypothetical protein
MYESPEALGEIRVERICGLGQCDRLLAVQFTKEISVLGGS